MSEPTAYASSLPFLLSQIGAAVAARFAQELEPLGIGPRAFGALSNLARRDGQTQQELADALAIHRNNMVELTDELELRGWLTRVRRRDDRRAFALTLTPAGREIVARVGEVVPRLEDELTAELSAAEHAALRGLLARLAAGLGLDPTVHPHLAGRPRRRRSGPADGA